MTERLEDFGSVRYDEFERESWPPHWLAAEGFHEGWLRPRGRTHSVSEFDSARERNGPLSGVLQGVWHTATAGGALAGSVGHLSDESGSIQLFVPNNTPRAGLGPGKRCEMEVVATQRSGNPTSSLGPVRALLMASALGGSESGRWLEELQRATRALDVSVVATAVRPLGA